VGFAGHRGDTAHRGRRRVNQVLGGRHAAGALCAHAAAHGAPEPGEATPLTQKPPPFDYRYDTADYTPRDTNYQNTHIEPF